MIAARSVRVIVRGTTSGGGSGGCGDPARPASARDERARVERRGVGAAGRRRGRGARAADGSRRNSPTRVERELLEPPAGVAVGAIEEQPRPQLRLGIRLVLRQHARRRPRRRGSIARLLMRISWLATATNELMLPMPVVLERRERVEVGLGEGAERHGQDVELAGLDEREQQAPAGPSNAGDAGRG